MRIKQIELLPEDTELTSDYPIYPGYFYILRYIDGDILSFAPIYRYEMHESEIQGSPERLMSDAQAQYKKPYDKAYRYDHPAHRKHDQQKADSTRPSGPITLDAESQKKARKLGLLGLPLPETSDRNKR